MTDHLDTYPVGAAKSGTASRDEACAAGQGLRQARRSQQPPPPSCCRYHGCTADGFPSTRFLPIHIHLTHNLTSSTSTPIPTGPGLQPANAQTSTNTANTNPRLRHAYTQAMEAHMHLIQMIQSIDTACPVPTQPQPQPPSASLVHLVLLSCPLAPGNPLGPSSAQLLSISHWHCSFTGTAFEALHLTCSISLLQVHDDVRLPSLPPPASLLKPAGTCKDGHPTDMDNRHPPPILLSRHVSLRRPCLSVRTVKNRANNSNRCPAY